MCGLAGQFRLDGSAADGAAVREAAARLSHRGPDESGFWEGGPAALGFRRLSILDLENGSQPMHSAQGDLHIVFNGEIYNHPELREELESQGARYRTRSDTETLLHLYEREGAGAFARLEGMFALALYDEKEGALWLARDGIGVKPLYYHFDGKTLSFASELRALASLLPETALDPAGMLDYLCYGIVHAPRTALQGALKLRPGYALRVDARGAAAQRFWALPSGARTEEAEHRAPPSFDEAVGEVERLLDRSVRSQLLSDVPVGAFLSGGVDSSLVTALMTRAAGKVSTFSIGFSGARSGLDESAHSRAVARHLGTDHHELILPADVLAGTRELVDCLDEPIADSAILPTFLLARFARRTVKVVLSGEGADEIFAGYNRYKAAYLSERVQSLPSWSRGLAAAAARRMGKGRVYEGIPYAGAAQWAVQNAHCGLPEAEGVCRPDFWRGASRLDPMDWLEDFKTPHSLASALAFDLRTVLCDALLMKVDKATMAASLEARVPFLDRRLVEYALRLPASFQVRRLKGKYLLRTVAAKYLPRSVAFRKKHGFIVPWEEWVRSPGNSTLDELFSDASFERWGVFDGPRLRQMLLDLRRGGRSTDPGIVYRVAVLGLWLESLKRGARKG
ncbi:MAG: asparagine synthase (glutamine-hydrolyzing) [Elusimicrobiota bacterium]